MRTTWSALIGLAGLAGLLAISAWPAGAEPAKDADSLIVHEWGTFLSVQGSDGVTMGGMVESEETLPRFVRERSLNGYSRAGMFSKMETPVTYFYTDKPMQVSVQVAMPRGLLTHWFPAVNAFGPPRQDQTLNKEDHKIGSFLDWGQFVILPDTRANLSSLGGWSKNPGEPQLYDVGKEDTWKFARETDSALIKFRGAGGERFEKFLFYRGLGTFDLPLEVRSSGSDNDLNLSLRNRSAGNLEGLFAIWVKNGTIRFGGLDDLAGKAQRDVAATSTLTNHMHLHDGLPKIKDAVAESLVKAGLYRKEALAMVNTWEKSYFQNEGLRILYVLPRSDTDAAIPIQIKPTPTELQRVMVGRIEVLTPDTEKRIEAALAKVHAEDAPIAELDRLGRLREPVLRRIAVLTKTPEIKATAETLIAKIGK